MHKKKISCQKIWFKTRKTWLERNDIMVWKRSANYQVNISNWNNEFDIQGWWVHRNKQKFVMASNCDPNIGEFRNEIERTENLN